MNTFKFVGKIRRIEEKGDRKYIDTATFDSGWTIERAKFIVSYDGNDQFIDVSGGKFRDNSKNMVKTVFARTSEEGKDEPVDVAWEDRFNSEIIDKVAKYRLYTIDLSSDQTREKLVSEGKVEDAQALAKQKYIYLTPYDFTIKIAELLRTNGFGDKDYVITGSVEYSYSYSKKTQSWGYYRSFVPTAIRLAGDDEKRGMFGRLDFYYLSDDFAGPKDDDGVQTINGYLRFYERMSKKNYFVPAGLQLEPENASFIRVFDMNYFDDAEVLVVGVTVEFFRGTTKTPIKDVELSEKNQLLIKLGVRTKEDIIAELSGTAYGDTVERVYMKGLSRGYAEGPKETDSTAAELVEQPSGTRATLNNGKTTAEKKANREKAINLWDDEDDEI